MTERKGRKELKCCPYCDEEIRAADFPWCRACGVVIAYCSECGESVLREVKACPRCGAELRE